MRYEEERNRRGDGHREQERETKMGLDNIGETIKCKEIAYGGQESLGEFAAMEPKKRARKLATERSAKARLRKRW
eukprot:6193070-Pleurochrysis_carterae.AAC.1